MCTASLGHLQPQTHGHAEQAPTLRSVSRPPDPANTQACQTQAATETPPAILSKHPCAQTSLSRARARTRHSTDQRICATGTSSWLPSAAPSLRGFGFFKV